MDQAKLQSLLGRSLTATEVTNLDLYLNIAEDTLEDLLCMSICRKSEARTFGTRDGYRTVFVDPFTDIDEIQDADGNVIDETEYTFKQWNRSNKSWYNSIVFNCERDGENLVISGSWGFGKCLPNDLQLLQARAFDQISKSNNSSGLVESKQVEDFRISYRTDVTQQDQFYADNALIINRYSQCNIGDIQHGDICYTDVDYPGVRSYHGRIY